MLNEMIKEQVIELSRLMESYQASLEELCEKRDAYEIGERLSLAFLTMKQEMLKLRNLIAVQEKMMQEKTSKSIIKERYRALVSKDNKTFKELLEYEFYATLNDIKSLIEAFDHGRRTFAVKADRSEVLFQLERCLKLLSRNEKVWYQRLQEQKQ